MRSELRIGGYVGINREVEEGMCWKGRNSMCRGPVAAKSRECLGLQRRIMTLECEKVVTGLLHHTGTEQAWERGFVPVYEVGDFSYERWRQFY